MQDTLHNLQHQLRLDRHFLLKNIPDIPFIWVKCTLPDIWTAPVLDLESYQIEEV